MQLQEALGVVKSEIQRRIKALQDMENHITWLGSLPDAEDVSATPPESAAPLTAVMHVPQGTAPRAAKPAAAAEGTRRSKWYEPVGKALASGPKGLSELERVVGVASPSFMSPVLLKYNHLFRKNGSGRGSTWELTEAGKREFSGKA